MTQQQPITPPPELVRQWNEEAATAPIADQRYIATQAARWGADMELGACVSWLLLNGWGQAIDRLRTARRPPSLKESAFKALEHILRHSSTELGADTIRRALEALPE